MVPSVPEFRPTADQEAAGTASSSRSPAAEACAGGSRSARGSDLGPAHQPRLLGLPAPSHGHAPALPLQPALEELCLVHSGCLRTIEVGEVEGGDRCRSSTSSRVEAIELI
jgi:hypothetical protein